MSSAFPLPTEAAPRKRGFFVALTAGLRGPGIMVVLTTLLVTTTALAQGGPDCTSALNAPISLPFNAVGLTTCGSGNGLTSATTTLCGSALYLAGEDHLFAFTPTVTGVVEVNVTSGSSSLGLFLYEGCPAGGNCLSSSFSGSGNQDLQGLVTAGTTYFVLVDSWTTPCHPSFSLDITAPAPLPPPTTQDCFGATPVCQDIYQELNSPVGEGNYPDEIDGGISCLGGGEVDGIWYTFTVQNSGSVCFSITPNDLSDDYDWAVYDLTNATCSDIYTDPSLEVSCNFSGLPGITGANGAAGNQNEPCVNVTVGQSFALYVSNWSQSPNGYTLDFGLPNATAGIFDQSPPTLDTLLQVPCSPDQMLVVFSEFVLCSSVQASDLIVSGPGGPYVVQDIESPICATGGGQDNQYVLTLSPGITGGGVFTVELIDDVEDLCGNIGNSGLATGPLALPLSVSASAIGAGCNGQPGSVNAQANGGTAPYTYDLAGTQQVNNGLFGNLMAGSYALTVTDAFGCLVDTVLDVLQAATFLDNDTMLMSVACAGGLDGMFAVSTSGNGGPWDYVWTDASGAVIQTTLGASADTLIAAAGAYQVVVTEGAAGSGCTDTLVATLLEPPPILINTVPDTTICLSGTALLSAWAFGGTSPLTLNWDSGLPGNGPHQVSPSDTATYTVFAEDANGCTSTTDTIVVGVLAGLSVELVDTVFGCPNTPVGITALNASGGNGDFLYDWGNGASSSPTHQLTTAVSGTYCMTLSDGCGTTPAQACTWISMEPVPPLVVMVAPTLGCTPLLVTMAMEDSTQQALVTWSPGDASGPLTGPQVMHTYTEAGIHSIALTVEWPNGCISDSILLDAVTVVDPPPAAFSWSPEALSVLAPSATFFPVTAQAPVSHAWSFDVLGTSGAPTPQFTFPNDIGASYTVSLVVTDDLGCSDSTSRVIEIRDELLVFVPNAFTPDGDGVNDLFHVSGNAIDRQQFELLVFDRWGEVIYSTTDPDEAWNGSFGNIGGEPVQDGVYIWKLTLRSVYDPIQRELTGHVTLLR